MSIKGLKIVVTTSIAIMFSLIAFNNITDYCTNFHLVRTILSMDSITATDVQWRAITSPLLQHAAYLLIITWETLTALVCWTGAILMLKHNKSILRYCNGRKVAIAGLTMGFALFMIGFVVVAGEWFYLWDSSLKSMHSKAMMLSLLLASFAYFVSRTDDNKQCYFPK